MRSDEQTPKPGSATAAGKDGLQIPSIAYRLVAFFGLLVVAIWFGIAHQLQHAQDEAIRDANDELRNLSLAFAEHIRSSVRGLDLSLVSLRQHWSNGPANFHEAVQRHQQYLAGEVSFQIATIGIDGLLAYSSLDPQALPISLADREHFMVHQHATADRLFISRPVLGRVSQRWSIQFTRPILSPDGSFGGVIVMSVAPAYFSRFYDTIGLGDQGVINLLRSSGEILSRSPELGSALGSSAEHLLASQDAASSAAAVRRVSPLDGVERLYGLRALPEFGLVVAVGKSLGDVAELSRTQRATLLLAGSGSTVVIVAFAFGMVLSLRSRAQAAAAMAQTRERYQQLLQMASDGVYILDAGGNFLEVSIAGTQMLGYEREQLARMTVHDIDARFTRSEIDALLQRQLLFSAEHLVFETLHRRSDGDLIEVEISSSVATIDGEPLIFCAVRDISERKQMAEALVESEARWKFALDGSDVGVFDWDLVSDRLLLSGKAQALLGVAPNSPIETIQDWERRVDPRDHSLRQAALQSCLLGETRSYSCEYRFQRAPGRWKWVLSRGAVVKRAADGQPLRMVGTFTEISDARGEAERAAIRTRVMEMLARGGRLQDILDGALRGMERSNYGLAFAVLSWSAPARLRVISAPDGASALAGREIAFEGSVVAAGESQCFGELLHAEAANPDYWRALSDLGKHEDLAPCWSEPLLSQSARVEGAFVVFRHCDEDFTPPDLPEVQQIASLVSIAINREHADEALQLAASVYAASSEAVMVLDAENRIVAVNPAFVATSGYEASEVLGQNPRILSSGHHGPEFYRAMWNAILTTGNWQGEIWNRRKNGEVYAEWLTINTLRDEAGEVLRRIAIFVDVTERKVAEEKVWRQANYDTLTGLPNRRLFHDRMEQALRKAERDSTSLALLFIDLDHFKDVNDTLGHEVGDVLLQQAAKRIAACVRASDTVARMGGDEFTVLLAAVSEPAIAERLAQEITACIAQVFQIGTESVYVSASVGITLFPNDGRDAETLFKQADQAMYAAKEAGRNGFSWFTPDMQHAAELRRVLAHDLRQALGERQFEVYFQPIQSLASGAIVKAEALLRWHHPERGDVSPAVFIPIAEEIGVISEIGNWVFREAAHAAARWRRMALAAAMLPIAISVNKSPRQFFTGRTHETWFEELDRVGLPAEAIVIEITEGLLLENRPEVVDKLRQFRRGGMRLSLDDFGTGYSAMSYLQRYAIDFIKIDQSFVRKLGDSSGELAIAEAIIAMAHKLGIQVIAEGVETVEQRALLATAGCDFVQGYLIARPMPAAEFEALCFAGAGALTARLN